MTDIINKTNLLFKKFSRKIKILLQNEDTEERETAKNAKKDTQDIFETIKLGQILRISFNDIVSIILEVVYGTKVFESKENIELAHQLAYK